MFKINPLLCTDGYKSSHHLMYPKNTTLVFSNFTPRNTRYMPKQAKDIVVFGIQYTVRYIDDLFKENFFNRNKKEVCDELQKYLNSYLGTNYDISHFEALYDLGYLPIEVRALEEGTIIEEKIPILTIHNTLPEFYWVTNFLETLISTTLWKPLHSASMSYAYNKIVKKYALETDKGNLGALDFQCHDFSMRGMQSLESSISSALGFMVGSKGSDTLPVLQAAKYYYNEDDVAFSVPACFPEGAEILTNVGFKPFEDLDDDDLVGQYNKDGTISFVKIIKYHEYEYDGNLINFKIDNDLKYIDFTVTPNHRVVGLTSRNNIIIKDAVDFNYHSDLNPIIAGKTKNINREFTEFDKLLIAFQADGSYSSRKNQYTGENTGTIPIRFSLKKDRKANRLREILTNLKFEFSESKYENGYYSFRAKVPLNEQLSKTFDWIDLSTINSDWANHFIDELQFWDGFAPKDNIISYSSTEKSNIDIVMAICSISSNKTQYRKSFDKRVNRKPIYTLTILRNIEKISGIKVIKKEVYYKGLVRCVTVDSGMIVVRQNDRVIISGNSEHAVMTAYGKENEIDSFSRILDLFPSGIVSMVSDQFDLWKVLTEYLPLLKDKIMSRDGKAVFRPDSGNPVDIICGQNIKNIEAEDFEDFLEICQEELDEELREKTPHGEYGGDISDKFYFNNKLYEVTYSPDWNRYDKQYYFIDNNGNNIGYKELEINPSDKGVIELLWDVFGGKVNEQGYKVLDSHVSCIYGDSITLERAEEILERLKIKGFSSTNITMGIGSYSMGYATRDNQGSAVKATFVEVDGVGREIFKDPITDDGTKKSAKGLLTVIKNNDGKLILKDRCSWDDVYDESNELKVVYKDGEILTNTTITKIRNLLN